MSQDCTVQDAQTASRAVADMTNAGQLDVIQKEDRISFPSFLNQLALGLR